MSKAAAVAKPAPRDTPPDDDFYGWTRLQADRLRAGDFGALDLQRLAEEIEAVGNEVYNALQGNLAVVIQHMLKWDHQPEKRTRSWALSIREHRRRVTRLLARNPSLKPRWGEAVPEAYEDAVDRAAAETGLALAAFPATCPYDREDILERPFPIDDPLV